MASQTILVALGLLASWPAAGTAQQSEDELSLLQQRLAVSHQGGGTGGAAPAARSPAPAREHYWPHARGHASRYSFTPYTRSPGDLNKSLAWSWHAPTFNTVIWGSLIDSQRNVYVASVTGIWKLSPTGQQLWYYSGVSEMPTLVGDALIGMNMYTCLFFALSLETGSVLWSRKIWPDNGVHGDFVEVHNGVAVVAVGGALNLGSGSESTHAAGVSARDGSLLWSFKTDCGLWNIMALFPDNETAVFSDKCGGTYRVGLQNGTVLWKVAGNPQSFTDGGSILGPNGNLYTCSNPAGSFGHVEQPGVLRKRRISDGALLWEVPLPMPCVNFPAVSWDGRSVVVAPGPLSDAAKSKEARNLPLAEREKFFNTQLQLVSQNLQRSAYLLPNLDAAIMSFDTDTGALQWRHDVRPFGGIAFAGDEFRAVYAIRHGLGLEHCWPAHWSAPTLDREGTVYIGRSSGDLYVYNPQKGVESTFHTGDGTMMAGAAFAPGLIVFSTCSSVYAFHAPAA
mmetsp:Transcript_132352/g.411423  ORF Transcript_132352/g.411423 Transcript_132352/m.411423 type:complete len:509 (+) Transcript_132352:61-1587(+)